MTKLTKNQRILTPGKSGNVAIQHFTVSEIGSRASLAQSMLHGHGTDACVPAGGYVRLLVDGELMMTDTPYELNSTKDFVDRAHGHVLVTGLGLGLVVLALYKNADVESVTVIESNPDVIKLTEPRIRAVLKGNNRFVVVEDDAFTWNPGDVFRQAERCTGMKMGVLPKMRWNCILHDIWPTINDLDLPGMTKLKRRYSHWLVKSDPQRFQHVWGQKRARKLRKAIKEAKNACQRTKSECHVY